LPSVSRSNHVQVKQETIHCQTLVHDITNLHKAVLTLSPVRVDTVPCHYSIDPLTHTLEFPLASVLEALSFLLQLKFSL
jgi:hypothetical protein